MYSSGIGSFKSISQEFLELEGELSLLDLTIDGVHFWERVRFGIHSEILESLGAISQVHSRERLNLPEKAGFVARASTNVLCRNPFITDPKQILFFGHPRRKLRADGKWWDIYCDPVIEAIDYRYAYYEKAYLGRHFRPAKTEEIKYLDLMEFAASVRKRLLLPGFCLSHRSRQLIGDIEEALVKQFGTDAGLLRRIERALLRRKMVLPLYEEILSRVGPRLVILVGSYGNEDLIEACRRSGIASVELQHGAMNRFHMGYSFSGERRKRCFPDYLFSFGDYWSSVVDLPIPEERVYPVGYPYLEDEMRRFENVTTRKQILFISQWTVGDGLSRLALDLRQKLGSDWAIVYKLHPREYVIWQREYPWLLDQDGVRVVGNEIPLYHLFAESRAQVGVYSTAIFEGLAFGLSTYLPDLPGAEVMTDICETDIVKRVSTAEELAAMIERQKEWSRIDSSVFFAHQSKKKVRDAIAALLGSEAQSV